MSNSLKPEDFGAVGDGGSVVRKAPILDRSGSLIGYIAIYDAVT